MSLEASKPARWYKPMTEYESYAPDGYYDPEQYDEATQEEYNAWLGDVSAALPQQVEPTPPQPRYGCSTMDQDIPF